MKAKFIKRIKGGYRYGKKQNDILVYSYRGREYDIEDIPAYKRPAWYFQNAHEEEQKIIDRIIDCEDQEIEVTEGTNSVEDAMNYFFKICE